MSPFYCESCDSHVTEDERATCRAVNCPTTPDDKPKLPACPCGKCHCVICGNQMDRDAALVAAEKRIAELEAALTKRIQRDVIEFNETHKRPRYVDRITAERDEARAEVGQLRVQLAGCGVAAMQNTESTAKDRAKPGDYGYSASYGDVCRAVDREMALRAQAERLAEAIEVLLADSQHTDHKCADDRCPVDFARKALAEYRSDK